MPRSNVIKLSFYGSKNKSKFFPNRDYFPVHKYILKKVFITLTDSKCFFVQHTFCGAYQHKIGY